MKLDKTAVRICGIVGGALFVLQALYTIWIYVRLTGGNLLSLLAPAEYLLLGAMALLNRREKGLIIGAWLLLVHNALSLLTSFISVAAAEQLNPVVRNLMLASTVGNLSAVLLAVVLLKSVRSAGNARPLPTGVCALPAVAQVVAFAVQMLLTGETGSLTAGGVLNIVLRVGGTLLVCLWAGAVQEPSFGEEPLPFEEEGRLF